MHDATREDRGTAVAVVVVTGCDLRANTEDRVWSGGGDAGSTGHMGFCDFRAYMGVREGCGGCGARCGVKSRIFKCVLKRVGAGCGAEDLPMAAPTRVNFAVPRFNVLTGPGRRGWRWRA